MNPLKTFTSKIALNATAATISLILGILLGGSASHTAPLVDKAFADIPADSAGATDGGCVDGGGCGSDASGDAGAGSDAGGGDSE
jgi:hypothetical protein